MKASAMSSPLFAMAIAALALLFAFAVSAGSPGSSKKPNVYELKLELIRNGKTVATPSIQLLYGKPGRVTIGDEDGAIRMQAEVKPGAKAPDGRPALDIDVVVLERIEGAWIIFGEPKMRVVDGKTATIDVSGADGFNLKLSAAPKYVARAADVVPRMCGPIDEPLSSSHLSATSLTAGNCPNCPSLPCPDCPNCCSASSTDGNPGKMSCCGGVSCCSCGACCDPPL